VVPSTLRGRLVVHNYGYNVSKRHHAILRNVPATSSIATNDGDPNLSPVSFLQEQVQRRGTKIFKPAKVGRGEIFWVASSWDVRRAMSNGQRHK
jgi:hypothetical protein